jgi:hypothetical protein
MLATCPPIESSSLLFSFNKSRDIIPLDIRLSLTNEIQ